MTHATIWDRLGEIRVLRGTPASKDLERVLYADLLNYIALVGPPDLAKLAREALRAEEINLFTRPTGRG